MITKTLPADSQARKDIPMATGCLDYFPAALAGVAAHSKRANEKHNPGEELHHSRGKSNDHADCQVRHLMDISALLRSVEEFGFEFVTVAEILEEANANAWRALALSQELYERFVAIPLAPRARLPVTQTCNKGSPEQELPVTADGLAKVLHRTSEANAAKCREGAQAARRDYLQPAESTYPVFGGPAPTPPAAGQCAQQYPGEYSKNRL